MQRLRRDASRIAERFALNYHAIEAESARVKRRYGSCHEDGRIKIRLTHARTGRPLKYSSMIDTVCHELAHLKHFNHGPRFRELYFGILSWARRQGIYRPTRREPAKPWTAGGQGTLSGPRQQMALALSLAHSEPTPATRLRPGRAVRPRGLQVRETLGEEHRQPEQMRLFEHPDPIASR